MTTAERTLTRDEVIDVLRQVGELLQEQGLEAHIYIVGGAAMAMVFDSRRTTRDVDAAIRSHHEEFDRAVKIVAERTGLAPDWVNSNASAFIPNHPDEEAVEMNLPGLRVAVASPEHLIAMKLRAMRRRDLDDLEVLFHHCHVETPEQAAAIHDKLFGDADIGYSGPDEALYAARLVFDRAAAQGRRIGSIAGDQHIDVGLPENG